MDIMDVLVERTFVLVCFIASLIPEVFQQIAVSQLHVLWQCDGASKLLFALHALDTDAFPVVVLEVSLSTAMESHPLNLQPWVATYEQWCFLLPWCWIFWCSHRDFIDAKSFIRSQRSQIGSSPSPCACALWSHHASLWLKECGQCGHWYFFFVAADGNSGAAGIRSSLLPGALVTHILCCCLIPVNASGLA